MSEDTPLAEAPAPETIADPTTKIEAPAPEPVEAETPVEPATDATATDETDDTGEPKRKNVPGSQRVKRKYDLLAADHEALLRRNEELERRFQQPAPTPQNPQGKPGIDREPTEADFPNDYFAFERSKTAWEVRQSVRDEIARAQTVPQQMRQAELQRERLIDYQENAAEVRERIPDFDKVVAAANVNVKDEVVGELLASEKSALLQYHLAKNPDKVRELNGMTGKELAREIGRLESRVHLPTAKKATEATPPPSQVRGTAATAVDPVAGPDEMNAYAAWRKKKGAA